MDKKNKSGVFTFDENNATTYEQNVVSTNKIVKKDSKIKDKFIKNKELKKKIVKIDIDKEIDENPFFFF